MRKKSIIIAGAVILAVLGAVFTAEAWRDRNAGAPACESRVSSYTKKEEGKKSETKARGRETRGASVCRAGLGARGRAGG